MPLLPWPLPTRTRQERVISAIVVLDVSLVHVCLTTRPFPESLIEPLAGANGLLVWPYDRL